MILVTGSTGLNGSAVIREFVRHGAPVRALVRHPEKAATFGKPSNVEILHGDMARPETLWPALDGVHRILMISTANNRLVDTQRCFIDAATRAGVRHIVKFSGVGGEPSSSFRFARMHGEAERYLEASGLAWTHLRPSQFMQVYFREVPSILTNRKLALPMGDAPIAPVDVEDIAKVAYALLNSDGHEGRRYEMTGPEALTMTEIAERLTDVVGEPIEYVDIDPAAKRQQLLAAGIATYFADAMDELFHLRRNGSDESRINLSTHHVFGVRPTTFAEFARRNADIFRGNTTPTHLWASGWQPPSPTR
jgi:uncharacterized protein YbjT (DUF2867 family)